PRRRRRGRDRLAGRCVRRLEPLPERRPPDVLLQPLRRPALPRPRRCDPAAGDAPGAPGVRLRRRRARQGRRRDALRGRREMRRGPGRGHGAVGVLGRRDMRRRLGHRLAGQRRLHVGRQPLHGHRRMGADRRRRRRRGSRPSDHARRAPADRDGAAVAVVTTTPTAPRAEREGMTWIPGGTFAMGSDDFYPEERPVHRVTVDGLWMDEKPVTAAEFRRFVRETSYVTVAERPLDPADYPDADPDLLVPGSLVFRATAGPVALDDYRNWWAYVPGAHWKRPGGKGTTINGRDNHPVVHVAHEDAEAYATWAGKELPTETEWEYAARGGLEGAVFAWGDEHFPDGNVMANSWQGEFPWQNLKLDGYERTSPVGSFPPNGFGLYDITGNVWEWTSDWYVPRHPDEVASPCCVPSNPRVTSPDQSYNPGQPGDHIPRRVIKGGSHLCAPNYCLRYRPAARQPQMIDTSMSHLGFRCIVRQLPSTEGAT